MPSNRLVPQQFAAGLTVDATRMEQDLKALAARLNAPVPADLARRWVMTHLSTGYLPDTLAPDRVTKLPWLPAYNAAPMATTGAQQPVTVFQNPWRQKGIQQPGIDPTTIPGTLIPLPLPARYSVAQDIWSWEVSWVQNGPCLLDTWTLTLATDTCYPNTFTYGVNPPPGKVAGDPVDDIVLQVEVDSALNDRNRQATLVPVLLRDFKANEYEISTQVSTQDMLPAMNNGHVPVGLCIQVHARQPIPENSRVRLIISIPRYPTFAETDPPNTTPVDMSSWGAHPWRTAVWSSHLTLLEPLVQ